MIVKLHDVLVIEIVHDLNFQLNLFDKIVLNNLSLVYDLDGEYVFGDFVANFIHFSESSNSNTRIG